MIFVVLILIIIMVHIAKKIGQDFFQGYVWVCLDEGLDCIFSLCCHVLLLA